MKRDFQNIFPTYTWQKEEFNINYEVSGYTVTLFSKRDSSQIEIKKSKNISDDVNRLKKNYFNKIFGQSVKPRDKVFIDLSNFRTYGDFREKIRNNLFIFEHPLFVPASRSFFSTIRQEIFTLLSMDEKIDKILLHFGSFFERYRKMKLFPSELNIVSENIERAKKHHFNILGGYHIHYQDRDWIEMPRGKIELSKASSGQQAALPLILALTRFPLKGRTLIVEEPEAHLFPTAQAEITDLIVMQSIRNQTRMFITTHSPYILSSLNIYLMRGIRSLENGVNPEAVTAYSIVDGKVTSIIDPDTKLISAEYIDSVSEKINEEFIKIMG